MGKALGRMTGNTSAASGAPGGRILHDDLAGNDDLVVLDGIDDPDLFYE